MSKNKPTYEELAKRVKELEKSETERKRVEQTLRESEERYRTLFATSLDAVLLTQPDGRILAANEAACRMFGRSETELKRIGRNGVVNLSDPNLPLALAERERTGRFSGELTFIRSDGTKFAGDISSATFHTQDGQLRSSMVIRDVNERNRIEEQLRANESDLAEAQRVARIGSWRFDVFTSKVTWSEELFRIFGLDKPSFDGTYEAFFSQIHPEDRASVLQRNAQARTNGQSFDFEYRIVKPTGEVRNIKEIGYAITDKLGKVVGLFGTAQDVTERKQVEQALRESEDKFRRFFEDDLTGSIITTPDGLIVDCNSAFLQMLGYKNKAEVVNCNITMLYAEPSERDFILSEISKKGKLENYETVRKHKDGNLIDIIENIIAEFDSNGKMKEIKGYFFNITEHKRAEERIKLVGKYNRTLIETSPDPLVTIGPDGKITDVNVATETVTGFPRQELIGTDFCNYFTDPKKARAGYQKVFRDNYVKDYALEIRQRDGNIVPVLYNASIFRNEKGEITGIFATARDITERKRVEEEVRKSHDELHKLTAYIQEMREEERKNIAHEIHDDLGQTLTALKIDISLLKEDIPEKENSLLQKVESMSKLVDASLAAVKRISSEIRPDILDHLGLKEALRWYASEFVNRTKVKCRLSFSHEELDLDQKVSENIYRLVQESLTNVIRHAKATEIIVSLRKKKNVLELRIKDNGTGIKPKEISASESFGLIGMRERARYCGGSFEIEGLPNKGTTITVTIPRAEGN